MAKSKFKKGDMVDFNRNETIKSGNVTIHGVVEVQDGESKYVIEYANGGISPDVRMEKFKLDKKKKYIFVSESELTENKSENKTIVEKIFGKKDKKDKKVK